MKYLIWQYYNNIGLQLFIFYYIHCMTGIIFVISIVSCIT